MAANTRMATAVQILCVIARKGPAGATAELISRSLLTNPVVVRRLLKCLEQHDLVAIRPGKTGGVHLKYDPAAITLDQIYHALGDDTGIFALRPRGNPRCPVDARMKHLLSPVFQQAELAVANTLNRTTLASLVNAIP